MRRLLIIGSNAKIAYYFGIEFFMKTIMVYHDHLFGNNIGSGEKLLHTIAMHAASSGLFNVIAVYGKNNGERFPDKIHEIKNITLVPFYHSKREQEEPYRCLEMIPNISEIIKIYNVQGVVTLVWSVYQFPIIDIPSTVPMLLISPFGSYCSNGNVRTVYVSGRANANLLKARGIYCAEQFFNPLLVPPFREKKQTKVCVFGRTGRPSDDNFDPISLKAFSRLEKEYGDKVKYIYVNPCKKALRTAHELGIKNIEFFDWLSESQLSEFYNKIDVFAHARCDGETVGIAIAEAMLAQCPVITHRSRNYNDHLAFLHEPYAKIAGIDNDTEYYEHMKWFVQNQGKIPQLGIRSREVAIRLFDGKKIMDKVTNDLLYVTSFSGKPDHSFNIYTILRFIWRIRVAVKRFIPGFLKRIKGKLKHE